MDQHDEGRKPLLDPISRLSEIMFGLLMTLTFTGTMSVALGAGDNVRSVLFAALGCNLAWGIVDGTMYVLTSVTERGRVLARSRRVRGADPQEAIRFVRGELPQGIGSVMDPQDVGKLVEWMRLSPDDGKPARIEAADLRAAGAVFLLVVGATLPPALPFLLVENVHTAMRLSNLIAIAMLFLIGLQFDRLMGRTAISMRIVVPVIGTVLVAVTIALGGRADAPVAILMAVAVAAR